MMLIVGVWFPSEGDSMIWIIWDYLEALAKGWESDTGKGWEAEQCILMIRLLPRTIEA